MDHFMVSNRSNFRQITKNLYEYFLLFSEPPSSPHVAGLPQNQTLREGQTVELVCSSVDGSPRPTLRCVKYLLNKRAFILN